jgi:septum formation protein
MEPIILASSSVRRQEILKQLGFPITVMTPNVDETIPDQFEPGSLVSALARKKVEYVLSVITDRYLPWVLGADTLIFHDGKAIGKPSSREEAQAILRSLSGRTHSAFTGMALYSGKTKNIVTATNETTVRFRELSEPELQWYLDSGEWQGVAGGYRIQGKAGFFIDRIEGQYHSVVGLPISDFYGILSTAGYVF